MKKDSKNSKRAEPIRKEISSFLKSNLCDDKGQLSLATRKKLAAYLEQSTSQVEKIVYYGQGSFDSLVSAVQFTLKIKPKESSEILTNILIGLKKHLLVDEADKKWYDLPISKNKRLYYASLIEQAEKLADEILLD